MLFAAAALMAPAPERLPVAPACIQQTRVRAIDAIPNADSARDRIEFAAMPAFTDWHAWIVRVARTDAATATIEILRLARAEDCARYEIDTRWQEPLRIERFNALVDALDHASGPRPHPEAIVVDGTGIDLRRTTRGRQVLQSFNLHDRGGPALSAIFRDLIAGYLPPSERPDEDWR